MAGPPPPARSNDELLIAQELDRTLPQWYKDTLCDPWGPPPANANELLWVQVFCPARFNNEPNLAANRPPSLPQYNYWVGQPLPAWATEQEIQAAAEIERTEPDSYKATLVSATGPAPPTSAYLLWIIIYGAAFIERYYGSGSSTAPPAPAPVVPSGTVSTVNAPPTETYSDQHYSFQYLLDLGQFKRNYTEEEIQALYVAGLETLSLLEYMWRLVFTPQDFVTGYPYTLRSDAQEIATTEELARAEELNNTMLDLYQIALCDGGFTPANTDEELWKKLYCPTTTEIRQSAATTAPPPPAISPSAPVTLGSSLTNYLGAEVSATSTNGSFRNKVKSGQGNEIVGPADTPRVSSSTLGPSSAKVNDLSAAVGYLEGTGATPLAAKAAAAVLVDVAKAQGVGVMSLIDQTQQNDRLSLKDKRAYQAVNQLRARTSQLSSCESINNSKSVRARYLLP